VELQDAASQAVVDFLPLTSGARVLDFCAGGGGKSLAMAARCQGRFHAWDQDPDRMKDLPPRAERAGVAIRVLAENDLSRLGPYDLVFCDAPCSGSGAWRRSPAGKWALTAARLNDLCAIQAGILDRAARLVAPNGYLAYATCSILRSENADQSAGFADRQAGFTLINDRAFSPLDGADGMYVAVFQRKS